MKITSKRAGHTQKPKKPTTPTGIAQNGPLAPAERPQTSKGSGEAVGERLGGALGDGDPLSGVSDGPPDGAMGGELPIREVLAFPAALLADLPRGFALHCRAVAPGTPECDFVVVTSKARYAAARSQGVPTFTGGEWRALAAATQNDRARWRELAAWLLAKRGAGSWKLTSARAFDGMPVTNAEPTTWTVGEVLHRLHAELLAVECA